MMREEASTKENNLHVDTMHIKKVKQIGNLHIKADLQDKIKNKPGKNSLWHCKGNQKS